MTTSDLTETTALVAQPFDLKLSEAPESEALLLSVLSERIAEMLEIEPEFLMSLLYRLDVLEKRILPVLAPDAPEPAHIGLARLVIERQKQRLATRRNIKVNPLEDADAWNI
jgi:hypothetical protein